MLLLYCQCTTTMTKPDFMQWSFAYSSSCLLFHEYLIVGLSLCQISFWFSHSRIKWFVVGVCSYTNCSGSFTKRKHHSWASVRRCRFLSSTAMPLLLSPHPLLLLSHPWSLSLYDVVTNKQTNEHLHIQMPHLQRVFYFMVLLAPVRHSWQKLLRMKVKLIS